MQLRYKEANSSLEGLQTLQSYVSVENIYHATLELKRGNWIIETASLENVRTQLDTYHNMKGCVWLSSQQIFAFHEDLNVQEVSYKRVDMPFL